MNHLKSTTLIYIFFFSFITLINAQQHPEERLSEYSKIPREVVYTHINKSILIKGKSLGFSSYVFDKKNKKLSNITSNLYCVITDEKDNIIKKGLFLVKDGIGSGVFQMDSLFTSGKYTFKAYTNWMQNFNEPNYFAQTIRVIDPEIETQTSSKTITTKIDIQFLPEGGHMVSDTENTIGVIAKNELGFGVANLTCELIDDTNQVINSFKLNDFGIGKFKFTPQEGKDFKVSIQSPTKEETYVLEKPKSNGVVMSLNDLGNRGVALSLKTNERTLASIMNKPYKLIIHNGFEQKIIDIIFTDEASIIQLIALENLFSGINIFTLFDDNNQPLLERLFFNYESIDVLKSSEGMTKNQMDSIAVTLPFNIVDPKKFNNFSISVLPSNTKSLPNQQNILSSILLQPYLRGQIQNAAYYFTDIDRKKKFELDNLLLTQGWSSYDWHDIFNNPPKKLYDFETGISMNANVNSKKSGQYLIYPTKSSSSNVVALSDKENTFERTNFYLFDEEKLRIGEIQSNGKVDKPKLFLQFKPVAIPDFKLKQKPFPLVESVQLEFQDYEISFKSSWENLQSLDEVVITTAKEATRVESLKKSHRGNVDVFDDTKRQQYFDFASYISSKGFRVGQTIGSLIIENPSSPTPNNRTPLVYLDNVLLADFSILYNFSMSDVDYIVVDKGGLGEGIRGSAGVIKIFTDPTASVYNTYGSAYQEYTLPLTFNSNKKFYTPIYTSYTSKFFEEYGVIDWLPDLKVDSSGNLNFKIFNTNTSSINLYIEGIANDGSLISEVKTLNF